MNSLRNELISVLDSSAFPPFSMIYNGIANFPARIYANEDLKVAFLISELKSRPINVSCCIENNFAMGNRKRVRTCD